jgi:hypothetical protein
LEEEGNTEIAEAKDDKYMHVLINKQRKPKQSRGPLALRSGERVISDPAELLETWASYFEELGTPKDLPQFDEKHHRFIQGEVAVLELLHDATREQTVIVNSQDVVKAITKLNTGKSPDYEGIAAEHLKHAAPVIAPVLAELFTAIIAQQYIPESFKRGMVLPIHKKGKDSLDPKSYHHHHLNPGESP